MELEVDKAIFQQIKELEKCAKTPVLDGLASNYTTGFFQLNKMASPSITVQKIDRTIDDLQYSEKIEGYKNAFRISKNSNFRSLWQTACEFWVFLLFLTNKESRHCSVQVDGSKFQ